jgi:hypothetical protein
MGIKHGLEKKLGLIEDSAFAFFHVFSSSLF